MSNESRNMDERAANTASKTGNAQSSRNRNAATVGGAPEKRKGSAPLIALAVAALIVMAFCAWSMSQYVQGNDPLAAFSNGGKSESSAQASASSSESSADVSSASSESGKGDSEDAGESADSSNEDSTGAANDEESPSTTNQDSGDPSPASQDSNSDLSPASQDSNSGSQQAQTPTQPSNDTISVNIMIDATAAGSNSASCVVSIPQGGTPYDALMASGANVNARGSAFGMYVAAINGLAEKDHGSMSGWLYSVNGTEPQVACDQVSLNPGDTVVWRYTTG